MRRPLLLLLPLVLAACGTATVAPATSATPSSSAAATEPPARIDMSETGFAPSTVTVKEGGTVTFVNVGKAPVWPASAPHPQHTDLAGFDALQAITPGSTYSYTFTRKGTWMFHDHEKPENNGSIVVE